MFWESLWSVLLIILVWVLVIGCTMTLGDRFCRWVKKAAQARRNRKLIAPVPVWNPENPDDPTRLIQEYGELNFSALSFIHTDTLTELVREANRMFLRRDQRDEKYRIELKELAVHYRQLMALVPATDGSHESELRARAARKIADEAWKMVEAEEKRQKSKLSEWTTPSQLVREHEVEDRSRAMDNGTLIFSEVRGDKRNPEVHKTYRLADGRYMLFVFDTPDQKFADPDRVRFHTTAPGSLSNAALEAVVADKAARAQQKVAQG